MNTKELRKASTCVFLACEEEVAKDISARLKWAADKIDELEKQSNKSDTELINDLEKNLATGLVSDDRGHWAIARSGIQSICPNPPEDTDITLFVEKDQWKTSIREAIISWMKPIDS